MCACMYACMCVCKYVRVYLWCMYVSRHDGPYMMHISRILVLDPDAWMSVLYDISNFISDQCNEESDSRSWRLCLPSFPQTEYIYESMFNWLHLISKGRYDEWNAFFCWWDLKLQLGETNKLGLPATTKHGIKSPQKKLNCLQNHHKKIDRGTSEIPN